ncbi:MAG: N-acetylglucosamine-6-phosphate deacetylase [Cyanobacteria bacterium Co-bin13]|nr:N-acetylglucosamine-6-phosphate deacetylase [Cyanobacteria bacterium Co-bin13]
MYALTHCLLYTGNRELKNHALIVEGSKIVDVVPEERLGQDFQRLDCQGYAVAPGFIDLQLNGCGGVMFNDAIAPATLDVMHHTNLKSGTTSFLPTLITTSDEAMQTALEVVRRYRESHRDSVLGLHLEGPYLNPKRKGIHEGRYVRPPESEMVSAIAQAGPDVVKLVTLAPEQTPPEQIQQLAAAGILVSAGHTDATYEEAMAGFDAGIQMVTHLFNAMSPWQGRQPGVVGATFSRGNVYAGIIVDGHHVHFASVRLAQKILRDRLILVTDATPPVGTQMDSFIIGGQEVFYRDGKCVSAEGTLGGSALTLIEAVANCVRHVGISLGEALRMATLNPARAIGCDDRLGLLAPNYRANLVLFDANFAVKGVMDQGHLHAFSSDLADAAAVLV